MEKALSSGAHTQEEQILDNFFEEGPYPLRRASLRLPSTSPTFHETAEARGAAPELAAPPCRPVVLRYIVREPSTTPHHQQQLGAGAPPPLVTEWLVEDVLPLLPASALHLLALAQRYTLVTLSTPRRRHLHAAGPAPPPHEGDEGLRTQRVGTVSDATLRRLLADIVAASTSSGSADGGDGAVVRELLAALALRLSPSPSLLSREDGEEDEEDMWVVQEPDGHAEAGEFLKPAPVVRVHGRHRNLFGPGHQRSEHRNGEGEEQQLMCRVSLLAFDPQLQLPVSADHVLEGILTTSVEPDGLAKFPSLKLLPDTDAARPFPAINTSSTAATTTTATTTTTYSYYCLEFQLFALPSKLDPLMGADAFSLDSSCPFSALRARSLLVRSPAYHLAPASSSPQPSSSTTSTTSTTSPSSSRKRPASALSEAATGEHASAYDGYQPQPQPQPRHPQEGLECDGLGGQVTGTTPSSKRPRGSPPDEPSPALSEAPTWGHPPEIIPGMPHRHHQATASAATLDYDPPVPVPGMHSSHPRHHAAAAAAVSNVVGFGSSSSSEGGVDQFCVPVSTPPYFSSSHIVSSSSSSSPSSSSSSATPTSTSSYSLPSDAFPYPAGLSSYPPPAIATDELASPDPHAHMAVVSPYQPIPARQITASLQQAAATGMQHALSHTHTHPDGALPVWGEGDRADLLPAAHQGAAHLPTGGVDGNSVRWGEDPSSQSAAAANPQQQQMQTAAFVSRISEHYAKLVQGQGTPHLASAAGLQTPPPIHIRSAMASPNKQQLPSHQHHQQQQQQHPLHRSLTKKEPNALMPQPSSSSSPLLEGSTSPLLNNLLAAHAAPASGGQGQGQGQQQQSGGGQGRIDITDLLQLPQNEAAARLHMSNATFSKRFRQANDNKRWPFRALQVIEKQLKDAIAKDQKATVAALEDKKRLLLSPAYISLKK